MAEAQSIRTLRRIRESDLSRLSEPFPDLRRNHLFRQGLPRYQHFNIFPAGLSISSWFREWYGVAFGMHCRVSASRTGITILVRPGSSAERYSSIPRGLMPPIVRQFPSNGDRTG